MDSDEDLGIQKLPCFEWKILQEFEALPEDRKVEVLKKIMEARPKVMSFSRAPPKMVLNDPE